MLFQGLSEAGGRAGEQLAGSLPGAEHEGGGEESQAAGGGPD